MSASSKTPSRISERVQQQRSALEAERRSSVISLASKARQEQLLRAIQTEDSNEDSQRVEDSPILHGQASTLALLSTGSIVIPSSQGGDDELGDDARPSKRQRSSGSTQRARGTRRIISYQLAVEEVRKTESSWVPTLLNTVVPPSIKPPRKFCLICGVMASYKCIRCGTPFCSVSCLQIHEDTRCLKWSV